MFLNLGDKCVLGYMWLVCASVVIDIESTSASHDTGVSNLYLVSASYLNVIAIENI